MSESFSLSVAWLNLDSVKAELELIAGALAPADFPGYRGAVEKVSEDAESLYRGYLKGQPIPGKGAFKARSGALSQGVYRREQGLLLWALGNASDRAKGVEEGAPEYDMKKALPTAPKARKAKDGTLYLIIPFRHGVPGTTGVSAMPKPIYAMAKNMDRSRVLGAFTTRESATGHTVPRWTYEWRGRLREKDLVAAGASEAAIRRYAGMVRMGGKGQTSYMTFRVMSQKSHGWIRPAQPALAPLGTAIDTSWALNNLAIQDALRDDLERVLGLR